MITQRAGGQFNPVIPADAYMDVGGRAKQEPRAEAGIQSPLSLRERARVHPLLIFQLRGMIRELNRLFIKWLQ